MSMVVHGLCLSLMGVSFLAPAIAFTLRGRRVPEAFSVAVASLLAALYGSLLYEFSVHRVHEVRILSMSLPWFRGSFISFYCDVFSLVLLGVSILIGLVVLVFSTAYLSPSNREHPVHSGFTRYYGLMLLFIGSMVGVSLAGNLVTLLIFYELTGICSCFLIAFYGTPRSVRASLMAFILTHIGSVALFAATMIVYAYTHSVSFSAIPLLPKYMLLGCGVLILIAALAKSAQLPLHLWLPEAMVAPTTVSAYLHAASMVKVGVFTYLRFCQYAITSGFDETALAILTLVLALATMFYGAFNYFRQRDLKRVLAWSTIVQLSIMMLALGIALLQVKPIAIYAAAYHVWNHSFAKALLFLTVGALAYASGRRDVDAIKGLAKVRGLKVLAYLWLCGALAISAIPPFGCFFSKIAILLAGLAGPGLAIASVMLMMFESYLLTLPALLRLGLLAFREAPEPQLLEVDASLPRRIVYSLLALAIASLLCGFLTPIRIPWP